MQQTKPTGIPECIIFTRGWQPRVLCPAQPYRHMQQQQATARRKALSQWNKTVINSRSVSFIERGSREGQFMDRSHYWRSVEKGRTIFSGQTNHMHGHPSLGCRTNIYQQPDGIEIWTLKARFRHYLLSLVPLLCMKLKPLFRAVPVVAVHCSCTRTSQLSRRQTSCRWPYLRSPNPHENPNQHHPSYPS